MQEDADGVEYRVLDGQGELVPDVVALARRVSPSELLALQLVLRVDLPEPVQVQGDGGTIDEDRTPSPPFPAHTAGVQESGNEGDEPVLIEPAEEPVQCIDGGL